MFLDFRSLPPDDDLNCDLCVVGGGIAGIAIAREFLGTGVDVCLLESGGFDPDPDTQALYSGENVGLPHSDLDACRMRYLGGSSNCWNGWCVPFDRHDFEKREWVPRSGWPIEFDELTPYYRRAQPVCKLGPAIYDEEMWGQLGADGPDFDRRNLRATFWQYSPPARFGEIYRKDLERAKNVRVLLNANAVDIVATPETSRITGVRLRRFDGRSTQVKAKHYILATGGLENARLLLASRSAEPRGLGNRHDMVGRFFMEHPYSISGLAIIRSSALDAFDSRSLGNVRIGTGLRTGARMQERQKVLGSMAIFDPVQPVDHLFKRSGPLSEAPPGHTRYAFISQSEQVPDPESRVTLSDARDALGSNKTKLDWRMSDIDRRSITVMMTQIGAELARLGLGRARVADWLLEDGAYWGVVAGNHHMGTTRMGTNPRTSVVDGDCRVHGYRNLFVAGSSVFVTSSFANPTLTIVALAVRLSDKIKAELADHR